MRSFFFFQVTCLVALFVAFNAIQGTSLEDSSEVDSYSEFYERSDLLRREDVDEDEEDTGFYQEIQASFENSLNERDEDLSSIPTDPLGGRFRRSPGYKHKSHKKVKHNHKPKKHHYKPKKHSHKPKKHHYKQKKHSHKNKKHQYKQKKKNH